MVRNYLCLVLWFCDFYFGNCDIYFRLLLVLWCVSPLLII